VFGANGLLVATPDQLRAGTLTTHHLAVWGHKSIYLPLAVHSSFVCHLLAR